MVSLRSKSSPVASLDCAEDSSSTGSGSADWMEPATPVPQGSATAAIAASLAKKYWPSKQEEDGVLAQLDASDRELCDAAMVNRYLRATAGDAKHALRRIRDSLAWRRQERPDAIVCTACASNPKSHYMQVVGYDLAGRPCIYSCLALATNRDLEDNRRHMISTFEQAIRMMPAPVEGQRPIESWVWVLDFHGFSIKDCDPRLAKIFLNLSTAHYPERLGTSFLVSAPTVFNTLWRAISPFIDPVTKQKIHFVDFKKKDNSKLEGLLSTYFDGATTRWLLQEMEDNRNKGLAASKAYSYPQLSKLASAGPSASEVAAATQQRRQQSNCHKHDYLGTPAFLDTLEGNPELLLPHLQALSLHAA